MNEEKKDLIGAEETAPKAEPIAEAAEGSEAEAVETKETQPTAEAAAEATVETAAEEALTAEPESTPVAETAAPAAEGAPAQSEAEQPTTAYARPIDAQAYTPNTQQNTTYTDSATWQSAPAPKKAKKKGKAGKVIASIASVLALAVLFGTVSGAIFMGMTANRTGDIGGSQTQDTSGIGAEHTSDSSTEHREIVSATDAMKEALEKAALAEQDQLTVAQINIIMEPAMVSITAKGETYVQSFFGTSVYPTQNSGSGIIVGENETEILVATNNHVVANAKEISVQFVDGNEVAALIKGTDAKNDLAVIAVKIEDIKPQTKEAITYATLGDSDALVIGEGVVAVGNALGFGQSVTDGIVSALNRAVEDSDGNVSYMIQTNAAINPGNSGGALVNMQGQVIGINSAKYADEAVEGMGFAIPINTALPILEELMVRTTRTEVTDADKAAYLGITPQDVTAAMRDTYGWPVGVYVYDVAKGTAAEKAGIVKGDIITKFDGEAIANTAALRKTLSYYEAGETIDITIERYERGTFETVTVTIKLDKKPAEATEETKPAGSFWDRFGN